MWAQQPTTLAPLLHWQYQPHIGFGPALDSIHKLYTLEGVWRDWICTLKMFLSCLWTRKEYIPSSDKCSLIYDLACFNWYTPSVMYRKWSRVNLEKSGSDSCVTGSHDAFFLAHLSSYYPDDNLIAERMLRLASQPNRFWKVRDAKWYGIKSTKN